MDYFTLNNSMGIKPFYVDYLVTYYFFIINTCLWLSQLVLIIYRVITIADFQFYTILVKPKDSSENTDLTAENDTDEVS